MEVKCTWRRHLPIRQVHAPLMTWGIWQWAVSTEKRSQWDGTSLLWLLYQPSLNCIKSAIADRFSQEDQVLGLRSECSVFLDLQLGRVFVAIPMPSSLCSLALLFSCAWRRGSEKGFRSAEVPPAAVYMRPHQEESVMPGKVEKCLCWTLCWSWLSCVLPETARDRELSVPHGEVLPVCVVGTQEGAVLTLSIKLHVFHFLDTALKPPVAWGCPEEEEEEKTGRNGSFSSKIIFSVDSQSVLPEIPIFGLANLVWLWSILSHTFTCTLNQTPSVRVCRPHLDPVSPWPGDLDLVRRFPWAPSWAGLLTHGLEMGSQCCWAAGIASGPSGYAVCSLSTRVRKLQVDIRY